MIGFKKNVKPRFNFEKESDFILDFLPTIKNEDWKYTNLKKYIPKSISIQPLTTKCNEALLGSLKKNGHEKLPKKNVIFFLDGVFQKDLSDVPSGVKIEQLNGVENTVLSLYLNKTGANFNTLENNSYLGFSSFLKNTRLVELNSYLTNSPYLLTFKKSYKNTGRLKIVHGFSNQNSFFNQNRLLFILEKESNVLMHEEIINFGKDGAVFNMVSEFVCLENAFLDFFTTQNDLTQSSLINTIFCTQQKNSSSNFNVFSLNGRLIRNNILVDLLGVESSANVVGTSLVKSSDHLDNFITISHLVENCKSNQFFKSVYDDCSSGSFCGKIYVEKGAQQTEAFQQNNNLMVSKAASVNAKPQLEIFADDVVCSHGCTIGAIDEDVLFYLRSRGIEEKEAISLLISAFLNELISNIENDEIKIELSKLFLKNIDV